MTEKIIKTPLFDKATLHNCPTQIQITLRLHLIQVSYTTLH